MHATMMRSSCACTISRQAARALTRLYDATMAPTGLRVTQFSLLRTLQRAGELHISGLSAMTGLDRSTLGRNLRLLEAAGYVRIAGGRDGRERNVGLTDSGIAAIAAALPYWQQAQDQIAATFGEDRQQLLFSLLAELTAIAMDASPQKAAADPS